MTYEKHDLCLKCMTPLEGADRCPKCGFDAAEYTPKEHHLKPRTILHGQYIIGCVLGEGGFGITYVGWDLLLHMMVAIKEYFPVGLVKRDSNDDNTIAVTSGANEDFFRHDRSKFIREAQKLAKFDGNPGVVSVKNYFMEYGTAYIVMEYIQGINLGVFTQKNGGKLDINQTVKLLEMPMRTLSQLHKANTYHRDISPENLMVSNSGSVKLIDFGSAMDENVDTKTRMLKVRHGYSPIELYTSAGKEGNYSDIYALCATIYKTITGVVPQTAADRVVEDTLVPPSKLGVKNILPRQERALMKGLSVHSANRYQNVEDLYRDLVVEQKKSSPVKKLAILLAVLVALGTGSYFGISGMQKAGSVKFKNPDFETMVESALELEEGAAIKPELLSDITTIYIKGNQIFFASTGGNLLQQTYSDARSVSLEDLQQFPALRSLYLCVEGYSAEDIAHISALTSLTHLTLISDDLTSLDMVAPLVNLQVLQIRGAGFTDLTPLSGLTQLRELYIAYTGVSDLTPLSGLENLDILTAHQNKITDWSPVEHVDKVTGKDDQNIEVAFQSPEFRDMLRKALNLSSSAPIYANDLRGITDITIVNNVLYLHTDMDLNTDTVNIVSEIPLDDLVLFENLQHLHLGIEGYSNEALRVLENLPQLKDLTIVSSTIDSIGPVASLQNLNGLNLQVNGVSDLSPIAGLTQLTSLNIVADNAGDLSPLAGLTHLATLSLDCYRIQNADVLSGLPQLRDVTIWSDAISEVPNLPNIETLRLELDDVSGFDWTPAQDMQARIYLWEGGRWVELDRTPVEFVSPEIEAMIRSELGFGADSVIVQANLDGIEQLSLVENRLSFSNEDISNVDDMIAADPLPLDDLARLRNLERLTLGIEGYSSEALEILRSMPSLRELSIAGHSITSLDAVAALPNLTEFHYWGNGASDFSFLNGLTAMQHLGLYGKGVTHIDFTANMPRLRTLDIRGCSVSSIEPLRACPQLRELTAEGNAITDWSPADHVAMVNGREKQEFIVEFTSPEFEALVRNAIGVPDGEPVFTHHLEEYQFVMLMNNHLFLGNFYEEMPEIRLDLLNGVSEIPLDDLKLFPNLRTLNLGVDGYSSESLNVLTELTSLADLRIWSNTIDSLSFLEGMSHLESFAYAGSGVSDFTPVGALTNLSYIAVTDNEQLTGLSFCEGMTRLYEVDFSNNPSLSDVSGLRNAQNLHDLHVYNCAIQDFSPVEHAANIHGREYQTVTFASPEFEAMVRQSLGIPEGNPVQTVHLMSVRYAALVNNELICLSYELGEMPADIPYLDITMQQQVAPIPLGDFALFTNLHTLDICAEGYSADDLSALSGVSGLRILKVISNGLDSLDFLHAMPEGLFSFEYDGAGVTDFEPIRARALTALYLFNNPNLTNLDFLADMHSLTSLTVWNCDLESVEALRGLENLNDLEIPYNRVSDFSAVDHIAHVGGADLQRIYFCVPEFEAMLKRTLDVPEYEPIYNGQLWPITEVAIVNNEIRLYSGEGEHAYGRLAELVPTEEFSLMDMNCFPNLQTLWICADGWSSEAIATLPDLNWLYELYIVSNTLDSLEFLNSPGFVDKMPMLGIFNYHGGGVTDFEPLRTIASRVFGISVCENPNLTDLEVLRDLPNLSHLWLSNNNIESLEPLRSLENLQFVSVTGNRITDFSPVAHVPEIYGQDRQTVQFQSPEFEAMLRRTLMLGEDQAISYSMLSGYTEAVIFNDQLYLCGPESDITLPNLSDLVSTQGIPLYDLGCLGNIERLSICADGWDADILNTLPHMPNLKELYIISNTIDSLEFLNAENIQERMPNLVSFNYNGSAVTDFEPLRSIAPQLRGVSIVGNPHFGDLYVLSEARKLEFISFRHCSVRDLTPLRSLPNLQYIYAGYNRIASFVPVTHVPNIEGMDLQIAEFADPTFEAMVREALGIGEGEPISYAQLANVTYAAILNDKLYLTDNWNDLPIDRDHSNLVPTAEFSLEDFWHFENLNTLWLCVDGWSNESLYTLPHMPNLYALDIFSNSFSSLDFLAAPDFAEKLPSLSGFYYYGSGVTDFEPLRALGDRLHDLTVAHNHNFNPDVITGMQNLRYLGCWDCGLTSVEPLRILRNLQRVDISGNRIADFEPIGHVEEIIGMDEQTVYFADRNFEQAVHEALGIGDRPVQYADLAGITHVSLTNNVLRCGHDFSDLDDRDLESLVSVDEMSLEDFAHFPDLQAIWLNLDGYSNEALYTLPQIPTLYELSICSHDFSSLDFLNAEDFREKFPSLGSFFYVGNAVEDFEPLRALSGFIRDIEINGNEHLKDLDVFSDMQNLFGLWLVGCPYVESVEPLQNLSNLVMLIIHDSQVSSLEPLRSLPMLRHLEVPRCMITDFEPVSHVAEIYGMNEQDVVVEFQSRKFKRMVTDALGLDEDADVMQWQINDITRITLSNNQLFFNMYQYDGDSMWYDEFAPMDEIPLADLCNFKNLHTLHLNVRGYTDKAFEGLESLTERTSLREIYIAGGHQDETESEDFTLSFLSGLNGIETLFISAPAMPSVEPISGLTSLKNLSLHNCYALDDLSPIAGLARLENLSLICNVKDLSPLAGLSNVLYLYIDDPELTNIAPISEMKNLRTLRLHGGVGVTSLEPLRGKTFWSLTIENVCVADWSPVKGYYPEYQNPEVIGFSSQEFKDALCAGLGLSPVKPIYSTQLATITNLSIGNGQISPSFEWDERFWNNDAPSKDKYGKAFPLEDLRHFKGLYSLLLYLPYNESYTLEPLRNLQNLGQLVLWGDKITDVSVLDDLNGVNWLSLGGKRIEDISPLAGMIRLSYLQLVDSRVTDLSPLANLPYLSQVSFSNNEKLRERHLEPIGHIADVSFSRD